MKSRTTTKAIVTILLSLSLFFLAGINRALYAQDTLLPERAVAIALENNFNILLAKMESAMAGNNNTPGNAGMLPSLNADVAQSYSIKNTYQEFFSGLVKDDNNAQSNTLSGRVQLAWTVFDGMDMFVRRDRLGELEKLGEIQVRAAIEDKLATVLITYYNLVQQQKALSVLREALSVSRERLRVAKAKTGLGSGSELTLLQSTVDYNADSSLYLDQENMIRQMKADLNFLLGREPTLEFIPLTHFLINTQLNYGTLVDHALKNNPALNSERINTLLAALGIKEAKSNYFPSVNLFSNFNYSKSKFEIGTVNDDKTYGITYGISANWNLFNGFTRNLEKKNAFIAKDMAEVSIKSTELDIRTGIFKIFGTYQTAVQKVNMESLNVEAARKNLFVAMEKYKLGGLSDIDLRATQQKQLEAESRLLNSQFEAKQAEISLLKVAGALMDTYR